MKQWNWKAILGIVVVKYLIGQLIGWFVLFAVNVVCWQLGFFKAAPNYQTSTPHLVAVAFTGFFLNIGWGYLMASWAPTRKMAHAAILMVLNFGFSLLISALFPIRGFPMWYQFLRYIMPPAILLGANWRIKTHGAETKMKTPAQRAAVPPIASPFGD